MSKTKPRKALEIKISTVVAVSVILHEAQLASLDAAMREITGGANDYFEDEFAVIDIGSPECNAEQIDWPALVALFKQYRLNLVAVRNAHESLHEAIVAAGLSLDATAAKDIRELGAAPVPVAAPAAPAVVATPAPVSAPAAAAQASAMPSMIVDTPVRAGQRVYARGADLIVTAIANAGAELIADGSIHVYAPLRGRALAGASGDVSARIFALEMEAELVSIAGIYGTFENGFASSVFHHPVQVKLVGDRIDVLPVKTH